MKLTFFIYLIHTKYQHICKFIHVSSTGKVESFKYNRSPNELFQVTVRLIVDLTTTTAKIRASFGNI
jgi:hypothetical protein